MIVGRIRLISPTKEHWLRCAPTRSGSSRRACCRPRPPTQARIGHWRMGRVRYTDPKVSQASTGASYPRCSGFLMGHCNSWHMSSSRKPGRRALDIRSSARRITWYWVGWPRCSPGVSHTLTKSFVQGYKCITPNKCTQELLMWWPKYGNARGFRASTRVLLQTYYESCQARGWRFSFMRKWGGIWPNRVKQSVVFKARAGTLGGYHNT